MSTLILKIEYDGTNYSGWQVQTNARTIQQEIQNAFFKVFGYEFSIVGAGRTDAGVHARGQIAHSKLTESLKLSDNKLIQAVNFYLPEDIKILNAKTIDGEFHAVRDAIAREYSYSIHNKDHPLLRKYSFYIKYPFDPKLLNEAGKIFIGKYDFTTFSKHNNETESYVCNVEHCHWIHMSPDRLLLSIKANRFVYGMVRALVGAMLDAARGKRTIEELASALEKKDRSLSSPLAPAKGLVLENVYYEALQEKFF